MLKRLIIKGNVQGVFCREYCKQNAKALRLKGAVSNLANGSVELLINSNDYYTLSTLANNLKKNPYKFKFHGQITSISIEDYKSKKLYGDYIF